MAISVHVLQRHDPAVAHPRLGPARKVPLPCPNKTATVVTRHVVNPVARLSATRRSLHPEGAIAPPQHNRHTVGEQIRGEEVEGPSPSTFATATAMSRLPATKCRAARKVPSPFPNTTDTSEEYLTGCGSIAGGDQVEVAVPIHVRHRHGPRGVTHRKELRSLEGAIGFPESDRHIIRVGVGGDQVGAAIPVDVPHCHR